VRRVLWLAFLACASGLCAQPVETAGPRASHRLVRLDYDNSSGEKGTTCFDRDENGRIDRALWELLDGGRYSINFYAYDGRGRLIRKAREFSDHKDTVQLYRYDDRGRLQSEEFFAGNDSKGVTTYEYDPRGRLVLIRCHACNGWIEGTIRLAYGVDGLRSGGELVQDGAAVAEIAYDHDRDGNLAKETWTFKSGWRQTLLFVYAKTAGPRPNAYASPNPFVVNLEAPVRREDYRYGDKLGGPSVYRYDRRGRLREKTFTRSDGLTTDTFYFYGGGAVPLRAYRRYSNGKNALFRYRYDKASRMLSKGFVTNDGASGRDTFSYDAAGMLKSADYVNSDEWLTGTMIIDETSRGLPRRGTYTDRSGLGASILFDYDGRSRLLRIAWTFSDGRTQVYSYSY
jgi:YD repeat-containing protein